MTAWFTRGRKAYPQRVVVLGGGFGGLSVAQALPRFEVVVVDSSENFEFVPNVHELISGLKQPGDLRLHRRDLIRNDGHSFRHDQVTALDASSRRLTTATGSSLGYDLLVVALGGTHQTFGVPGAAEHSWFVRSVDGCTRLGHALENALKTTRTLSVAIIGGGLEGIEVLGEILRKYRTRSGLQLHLVESGNRLLQGTPQGVHDILQRHCERQGVTLHLGHPVTQVEPDHVVSGNTSIPCQLAIWTAGVAPPPLLYQAGLSPTPDSWATVEPTLASTEFPNLFVIGDAAGLPQRPAKQAYHAQAMGSHVASNLLRLVQGHPLRAFEPPRRPAVITFGDLDTFVIFENYALAGPSLAPLKEAIYHLALTQLAPPTRPRPLAQLLQRVKRTVDLPSWHTLRTLPDLRVLTTDPRSDH